MKIIIIKRHTRTTTLSEPKNRKHNGQNKKVQKDKQRFTKHTYKTKDRVTRTRLKTGGEFRCFGRVGS
jgi:hypothetical protein